MDNDKYKIPLLDNYCRTEDTSSAIRKKAWNNKKAKLRKSCSRPHQLWFIVWHNSALSLTHTHIIFRYQQVHLGIFMYSVILTETAKIRMLIQINHGIVYILLLTFLFHVANSTGNQEHCKIFNMATKNECNSS